MLVRKINPNWLPSEHPEIAVGDVVDFPGNTEKLVADGEVELVEQPEVTPETPVEEAKEVEEAPVEVPAEEPVAAPVEEAPVEETAAPEAVVEGEETQPEA